jgi:hypothetical protein
MAGLADFLKSADVGVESHGDGIHVGVALLEALHTGAEIAEIAEPAALAAEGAATIGGATVFGVGLAVAGPVLGLAGVFMALGSGYEAARAEIQNEAVASGFSQGFVAGILNMSGVTVSSIFGRHGVIHHNTADEGADYLEAKAYNRGLVAGYTMAHLATPEQKKAFIFEIRKHTPHTSAGNWTDLDKRNYVIDYAAQLRVHFLHV